METNDIDSFSLHSSVSQAQQRKSRPRSARGALESQRRRRNCRRLTHAADEEFPLDAIADGYRALGLEATAEAVDRAAAEYEQTAGIGDDDAWAEAEERVNEDYRIEEEDIAAAIERTLAQEPELFAPTG